LGRLISVVKQAYPHASDRQGSSFRLFPPQFSLTKHYCYDKLRPIDNVGRGVLTDVFPSFLWQFRRPLAKLGGQFAHSLGEEAADTALAARIVTAYRKAAQTDVGDKTNIWLEYFAAHNAETHRILAEGTVEEVGVLLRDPSTSDFFYGFDGPTATDVRNSKEQFSRDMTTRYVYECLLSFAEALGAVRIDNPETAGSNKIRAVDDLLDLIDAALGVKIRFPNPFRDECGVTSTRGVVSHRAALALYEAWRILEVVGGDKAARIVEIGAGLGRNAFFARQMGATNYAIVDLPTTNVAQAYFLGRTVGQDAVSLYGEQRDDAFVTIMPPDQFLNSSGRYDLAVNIDSMTEFSKDTAVGYLEHISRSCDAFLSINHEANDFAVRNLVAEIRPKPATSRSLCWIRQGYVEELSRF
jgi:hypothetical protein